MRHSYPAVRELNAEALAIAAVDAGSLSAFARELALPFPALSDAGEQVYSAFGLGKGIVIRPRTVLTVVRLAWRARRLYRPVGDVMQVGGDFLVDRNGVIRYAHRSEDPSDRPEVGDLLRRVADLT